MQIFPQQEEAATGKRLMQQPRCGHCGAESVAVALPAESKPDLVFPTFLCVRLYCTIYVLLCVRRHSSDVYLGMSPNKNGGSSLMYWYALAKLAKPWQKKTIQGHG